MRSVRPFIRLRAGRGLRRWGWLALFPLALPIAWPFFTAGLLQGLDIPNHLMRLVAFDQQIRAGNLYPRWMPDLVLGYGYPLFNYYAPGTYYLAELFRLAGLAYAPALSATLLVLVLVAGWGMWWLAADFYYPAQGEGSGWPVLVAAVAYMYAPYLLVNVFVRGAMAELGAQALLPWVLWSLRRLLCAAQPVRYVLPFTLSLAGLALAHNLTLVMVAPVLLADAALLWWRRGRPAASLAWLAAGGLLAVGLSAFFWWPLLGERGALANHMAEVARAWLPSNMWTWPGFLDAGLTFTYSMQSPFGLGLVQVVVAVVGLAAARRWWNAEWLLWALVAVCAGVVMGRPFLPVWLNVGWLLVFQFPWRLLVLVSVPLALFAGGSVLARPRELERGTLALLLVVLILVAQRPRLDAVPRLPADQQMLGPATVAQFEVQTGSLGATTNYLGTTSDFMPRWVDLGYGLSSPPAPGEQLDTSAVELALHAAGPVGLDLTISSARPGPVRFSTFYFPGWRVTLDDGLALPPYPSTHLGLLTVDVPAGEHRLRVAYAGTRLQQVATMVSLAALAALGLFAWRLARAPRSGIGQIVAAASLVGLLLAGLYVAWPAAARLAPVTIAAPRFEADGLELAGFRYAVESGRWLDLRPYWYVRQTPADVEITWRLLEPSGSLVSEMRTRPFYDSVVTMSWRAGTLVADAGRLTLPGGLAAGQYALAVCMTTVGSAGADCHAQPVGTVALAASVPGPPPPAAPDFKARFGADLLLAGYRLRTDPPEPASPNGLVVIAPGRSVDVTLMWRAAHPLPLDYHGFVNLVDGQFHVLAQVDRLLGPYFFPPRLWDNFTEQPDSYQLTIPPTASSGVYWPTVGVYDFATLQRLPAHDAAGADLRSEARLAPLKVLNPPHRAPQQAARASFEDLGQLMGYDLDLPAGGLRAGRSFSVTLYYAAAATAPATADYTRFLHLYSAGPGLVAQSDASPQNGLNPTSAWLPGEVVADTASLTLPASAAPGRYALQLGFYDPASGDRLNVYDGAGQLLPDGQTVLTELEVQP